LPDSELEDKMDNDKKDEYDVIRIDSNMSLPVQRKLAAKKHRMETENLAQILSEIAHDSNQFASDRIKAVGQASKILGLDAPQQIEASFKGIMLEMTNITNEEILQLLSAR
jgi:hypothetical protein